MRRRLLRGRVTLRPGRRAAVLGVAVLAACGGSGGGPTDSSSNLSGGAPAVAATVQSLARVGSDPLVCTAGQSYAHPLTVQALTAASPGVAGVNVVFTAKAGFTVTPKAQTTDAQGIATVSVICGSQETDSPVDRISAAVPGAPAAPVVLRFQVQAGALARLVGRLDTVISITGRTTEVGVTVADQYSNGLPFTGGGYS